MWIVKTNFSKTRDSIEEIISINKLDRELVRISQQNDTRIGQIGPKLFRAIKS